jgi:hypothetical protein
MVIGLVVVGVALALLGVWLVRQTRYDPPVLAPLERMGDDSWRKTDPATQRRILDELRPEGAEPLATGTAPPSLDAEFESDDRPVPEFDDLRPGLSAEVDGSAPPESTSDDADLSHARTDTEQSSETELPVEVDGPVETDSPVEADGPVEADSPVEAEGPVETDSSVETDDAAEVEMPTEAEESSDTAGR